MWTDLFLCHRKSTEGTYHPRVRKMCQIPNLRLIGENITFLNETFKVLIFVKIHLTEANFW